MQSKFTLTPTEQFPEDLEVLGDEEVHVLHSRIRRQMDAEYGAGWFSWETEMRLDEVREELNRRENGDVARIGWEQQARVLNAS
ncbi:hypothetical protein GC088_14565 [Arthrobacter sp. JZ12]|uniref:hypothetical protein n=1 Tax=Arthrobacter sp. JZ12 TaxID=2654190 RepID=UPI002B478AAF|nr:hypothetical protein [Arthrobacter sp. JZ12]WRH26170.1 hypothetical protein GC088_14565 [Arthrobacter sp. JZ12]